MRDLAKRQIGWATAKETIVIVYIIAIVFVFLAGIFASSYDSSDNNGSEYSLNDGWYYEADGQAPVPFNSFGTQLDSERICLVHRNDESIRACEAIAFYNYYSAVEVYCGDLLIYRYGSLDDIRNGRLLGNYYSMVDIHGSQTNSGDLRVIFLNTQPQTVYGFRGGSGAALEMAMVREYIPSLLTPFLSLLFLSASGISLLRRNTRDLITRKHKWLMMFAVAISFWEITDTQLLMDIGLRAGTVCLLSFEGYMILPIPLLMLVYHSCKKLRTADIVMCCAVFVNYIVLNVLNFSGICGFLYSLLPTHIIICASILLCLSQIIIEYQRKPGRSSLLLLLGFLVFVICAAIQYLNFFVNPSESNSRILQIGTLMFLLLQMVDVFKAINDRFYRVAKTLERQTEHLKKTFKTLIPDDVDKLMLNHSGTVTPLESMGSTRNLTVLESDIRGFSEFIQDMTADEAIHMLNHYLGVMTNIIRMHDGIVLDFIGDAIVAIFDEKNAGNSNAEKAVFSAVEMQLCMDDVRAWNRSHGYPEFEMGIGIATGQAYVGYIGSDSRMEYDAIGTTINLGSRIESYSTGGQILISRSCKNSISKNLIILDSFTIAPKGYAQEVEVFLIGGFGEPYNLICGDLTEVPITLQAPIPVTFNMILQKQRQEQNVPGTITAVSSNSAILLTDAALKIFDDISVNVENEHISCKVVSKSEKGFLVRMTSLSSSFKWWKAAAEQREVKA